MLKASRARFPFVERVFADGAYAGRLVEWARDTAHVAIEVVRRLPFAKGFVVLKRRWVVERSFAWIMKSRRLVRDTTDLRAVWDAIQYMAATGCQWAMLAKDVPPFTTVQS